MLPLGLYSIRWNIETGYYEMKSFWSLRDYMVRSVKGIERLINLTCISYTACRLLPYYSMDFVDYKDLSPQEVRYRLGEKIRMGIIMCSLEQIVETLKKADVLRTITNPENNKPYRSTFSVNPFIVGRGKWSDIKELRAQFDYNSGLMTTQSIVTDRITGETMAKITHEIKKNQKQIPGQITLFDDQDKIITDPERYTLDQIKQLFDYDTMLQDAPGCLRDIDSVMTILHTAMNTNKPTIRINGQDKPAMSVIAKLMKLNKESIMYAIGKFSEQTDRIKNTSAYMLTILYNAQEQYFLDSKNKTAHDTAPDKKISDVKTNKPNNAYASYHQRTYDYEELERQLLDRNHE